MATAKFSDVHRLESLHGGAYHEISTLLIEHQTETVRPVAVFFGEHERVERRFHRVLLSPEAQPTWQAQLKNNPTY